MTIKGEITMDDYEIVSIEAELDRLRDEKEKPAPTATDASPNIGCGVILLHLFLGLLLLRLVAELVSFIF
jgi:hypothetical protein